jgi:hypothetical protein
MKRAIINFNVDPVAAVDVEVKVQKQARILVTHFTQLTVVAALLLLLILEINFSTFKWEKFNLITDPLLCDFRNSRNFFADCAREKFPSRDMIIKERLKSNS